MNRKKFKEISEFVENHNIADQLNNVLEVKKEMEKLLCMFLNNSYVIDREKAENNKVMDAEYNKAMTLRIRGFCESDECDDLIKAIHSTMTIVALNINSRYEVFCYDCDEYGNIKDETPTEYWASNDLSYAIKKGAEFYRYHSDNHPTVNIFDNVTNEYIAEWN